MSTSENDSLDELSYARLVGERLRQIRQQKKLSLSEVESATNQEFKASVVGAYERGERMISVPRLERLALNNRQAARVCRCCWRCDCSPRLCLRMVAERSRKRTERSEGRCGNHSYQGRGPYLTPGFTRSRLNLFILPYQFSRERSRGKRWLGMYSRYQRYPSPSFLHSLPFYSLVLPIRLARLCDWLIALFLPLVAPAPLPVIPLTAALCVVRCSAPLSSNGSSNSVELNPLVLVAIEHKRQCRLVSSRLVLHPQRLYQLLVLHLRRTLRLPIHLSRHFPRQAAHYLLLYPLVSVLDHRGRRC